MTSTHVGAGAENTDARLHEAALAHLFAAGAADAEQQAADFVERVRTGRSNTPPDNDAQLWGATSVALGATLSSENRMIVARQLIAILRRLREPHRRTWAPGDALPTRRPRRSPISTGTCGYTRTPVTAATA
ncbi:hypothetical protein [Nocardia carnea]|uniref:hypothetical protein n=1 Tax=Nocardia carnea TaxID=37328 RepID=UPI002457C538|nr:hypothetical protein [Nocardia carnea]